MYTKVAHDVAKLAQSERTNYDNANRQLHILRNDIGQIPSPSTVTYDGYRGYIRTNIMPQIGNVLTAMNDVRPLPSDQADLVTSGLNKLIAFTQHNADLYVSHSCNKKCAAARLNIQANTLKDDVALLKTYVSTSDFAKAYATGFSLIQTTFVPTLAAVTLDRFAFSSTEDCRGTYSGGRITTYVLGETNGSTQTVTVVCRPRIFLSGGFAFSSLQQQTFVGVPVNPATLPTPTPMPVGATPGPTTTPFSTIARGTVSEVRPIPIVMANVNLFGDEYDDTFPGSLYATFGVALGSGSANTVIDYVGGLSYGLSRTLLFTVGLHLGDVTQLAPGYKLGDVIPTGTNPQTVTRTRLGYFIGITYGKQP